MRWTLNLLIGVAAMLTFSTSASAATLRITSGSSYTATARQTLTIDPGGLAIACDRSFTVALASTTIASASLPTSVSRIGSVTRGSAGNCSGGVVIALLGLPWQVDLTNGTGTADGSVITVRNVQFAISIGALACLYQGDWVWTVSASGTQLSTSTRFPLFSGGFLCANPMQLVGTLTLSPALAMSLTP